MADFAQALIAFGHLVAFFEESAGPDDAAVVRFEWFGNPLEGSLDAIPQNRARLHDFFQCLIGDGPTGQTPSFPLDGMAWEPVDLGADIGVGFAWNPGSGPLRLGLGAAASFSLGSQDIDLAVLARLLHIHNGSVTPEIPGVVFGGSLPVPDFLQSAGVAGEIPSPTMGDPVSVTVDDPLSSRTMAIPGPQPAWDAARLAAFVLQAWVRDQATGGDTFFNRMQNHLFPLFGDPPGGPIAPFPLFGAASMGQPADFDPWVQSVVRVDDDPDGALTFLWHVRALLTGNEDPDFFGGSFFFPLEGAPSTGSPPTMAQMAGTLDPLTDAAFVGVEDGVQGGGDATLVLRIQDGGDAFTIPLAGNQSGGLVRPPLTQDPSLLGSTFPVPGWLSVSGAAPVRLDLVDEALPAAAGFGGALKVTLLLTQNHPVGFEVALPTTPPLTLTFPGAGGGPFASPLTPEEVVLDLLDALTGAVNVEPAVEELVAELLGMLRDELTGGTPQVGDLLTAILATAGDAEEWSIGDGLTVGLGPGPGLEIGLELDELDEALEGSPVVFETLGVEVSLALSDGPQPIQSARLDLTDLRIDPEQTGAGGVAGSFLGDLTEAPGFDFFLEWTPPDEVVPGGGGRIPVSQVIGPLELSTLHVEVDEHGLDLGLDAALSMGPVHVTPYELGVRIPFDGTSPTPFLHGLGLGMDAGGIKLAGHFGEVNDDYVGAAVVSVVDFFELTAIGGYTKLADSSESLFIFASLVAPLGGPPFLFVTGVAGGLGYNRQLPPPGPMSENPFMRVMRGEIDLGGSTTGALQTLSQQFLPAKNQHWIAAGLQFISFGFIHGKLVVVVGFPNFSLRILGSAAFGISPVAYFELELEASADDESFLLVAGLSHNSYVIHPDIFSLHGQFGLATWHGGEHAGDFVFSIGGYHDAFPVPGHYPTLDRVGVTAVVYGFVRMTVTCYFATTPDAMMAGASVSLSAEFAGIAAGLDVYIDVYIQWDPFFIQGRMGVVVWFEFMGRHEIGVHLEIHTPPLGGVATIDLALVSFDVEFGQKLGPTPRLEIHEFVEGQLGVEADPWNGEGARVAALATADRAGLFRLEMLGGRTAKEDAGGDAQEGLAPNAPIRVGSEFAFAVRSRLPFEGITELPGNIPAHEVALGSWVDLPLCTHGMDLETTFSVEGPQVGHAHPRLLDDTFPAAQFGSEGTPSYQPDSFAKGLIGSVDHDEAVVDRTHGLEFAYRPRLEPEAAEDWDLHATEEPSVGEAERYPLPLGPPTHPFTHRIPKAHLSLSEQGGRVFKAPGRRVRAGLKRTLRARQRIEARTVRPPELFIRSAEVERRTRLRRLDRDDGEIASAGMPVVAPPDSPVRRMELSEVALHRVEPRTPAPTRRDGGFAGIAVRGTRARASRKDAPDREATLTRLDGAVAGRPPTAEDPDRQRHRVSLPQGHGAQLEMRAGRPTGGTLRVERGDAVRAVFLGGQGEPVADLYLTDGRRRSLPPRARRLFLFQEGVEVPVSAGRTTRLGPEVGRATEAVGVEHDSRLTALGPRCFAAHGCVLETASPLGRPCPPLEVCSGAELFHQIRSLRVLFPAVPEGGTLVLVCEPDGGSAGSAVDDIRWRSVDAALGEVHAVPRPDRLALVMPVRADTPWALQLDLGRAWRPRAVVWTPDGARETVRHLSASAVWDLVDERRVVSDTPADTTLELELQP